MEIEEMSKKTKFAIYFTIIFCILGGGFLFYQLVIVGTDDENGDVGHHYFEYTQWNSTDGYIIQILDDECLIADENNVLNNVCKFEENANNTGISKITICNSYGTDCRYQEMPIREYYDKTDYQIHIMGRTFYYHNAVQKD